MKEASSGKFSRTQVLIQALLVCVVLHSNAHMQVGENQVYQLRPAKQVIQLTGLTPFGNAIQHWGTGYYVQDVENSRYLHLGADLELLDVIGPIETGTGEFIRPSAVGMKDDSLFVHYGTGRVFYVFHNGEFIRSFSAPARGIDRMAFTDDVILFGARTSQSLEDHPILFAGYNGTLPPGHADGFGGWGGDVDFVRSRVDVFIDSRGDILAVLCYQPFVQRYSHDYELIETYDLTSFEAIETRWNRDARYPIQLSNNSLYEDRLYIYTINTGANDERTHSVVMLDINPEGMTPVGTLELEGPTEGEAMSVIGLCVGPDNQLVVYDPTTGSLLIYEIPI